MNRWALSEFEQVAKTTGITPRTLDACREVLVDGLKGADVARKHGMLHPQISRSIAVLKEKHASLGLITKEESPETSAANKTHLVSIVKQLLGPDFEINEPVCGEMYEGRVLAKVDGFCIQKVGRSGVIHDLKVVAGDLETNKSFLVSYSKDELTATFVDSDVGQFVERIGDRRKNEISR